MHDKKRYYITTSNFKKLVAQSTITMDTVANIYAEVYDRQNLAPYLNQREITTLGKRVLFLHKADDFLIDLEEKCRSRPLQQRKAQESAYIFVSNGPKYHLDATCKTLTHDFSNFTIPEEVVKRGSEEVAKFREFALSKRKLLNEGSEDVFLMHLKTAFHLKSDLHKVLFENSGKFDVTVHDNSASIHEIVTFIDDVTKKIEAFRQTDEGGLAAQKILKNSSRFFRDQELTPAEKLLWSFKGDLVQLVTQYNIVKHKGLEVTFTEELLMLYGFKACQACCPFEFAF